MQQLIEIILYFLSNHTNLPKVIYNSKSCTILNLFAQTITTSVGEILERTLLVNESALPSLFSALDGQCEGMAEGAQCPCVRCSWTRSGDLVGDGSANCQLERAR